MLVALKAAFGIAAVEVPTNFQPVLDNLDLAQLWERIAEVVAGSVQS